MKKSFWYILPFASAAVFLAVLYLANLGSSKQSEAATHDVTLTTIVTEYITLDITAGDPVAFGNLTPGTPIKAPNPATVASVTTSAANGYTLGLSDGSDTNSAFRHTDNTTYIADYAGSIAVPTAWSGTGLGVTLFTADSNKEVKWGTGTTYSDANNKYAGIPSATTTAHTATGFHAGADTSSWAFQVDVPNSQKTGAYSGAITLTATAVLS